MFEKDKYILVLPELLLHRSPDSFALSFWILCLAKPKVNIVRRGHLRDFQLFRFCPAEGRVVLLQQLVNRVNQPRLVAEFERIAKVAREDGQERCKALLVAREVGWELEQNGTKPVGSAERVDGPEEDLGEFLRVLQAQDVSDALVSLGREQKTFLRSLDPVFQRAFSGQPAEGVVDLHAVEPTCVVF